MNQQGQGFSVFKLLIAAIVAVFILTILLQILSGITPPTQGDPNQEAASKIKSLVNFPGSPQKTGKVIFTSGNKFLIARTIAEQTGSVPRQHLCLDVSDSFGEDVFSRDSDFLIEYLGTGDIETKLNVVCDRKDELINIPGGLVDFPRCGGFSPDGDPVVCLVSIIPTS